MPDKSLIVTLSVNVAPPSFNKTPSIVTPDASVFSLIVSMLKVPSNLTLPVSPNISMVWTELPFFNSIFLKLPSLDAEIKLVPPTA